MSHIIQDVAFKVKLDENGRLWLYDNKGDKVPLVRDIIINQELDNHEEGLAICTVSLIVSLK